MAIIERAAFMAPISYRDVEFIFVDSSVLGGRKVAIKKFVNTDRQLVEDLGLEQRSYNVTGYVTLVGDEYKENALGTTSTSYLDKRDRLVEALEAPGTGKLVHPMYGVLYEMAVTSYTLNESVTSVGIGRLDITFEISNADGLPEADETTISEISSANDAVLETSRSRIEEFFDSKPELLGVYNKAKEKVQQVADKVSSALEFAERVTDEIDKVGLMVSEFQSDVIALATAPQDLAQSITNVFQTINGTIATVSATFDVYQEFFEFGFLTDIELRFDTAANHQSNLNNNTLNNAINANALSGAYLAASGKDYKTVREIDADIDILENQLDAIRNASGIDASTLTSLLNARESTLRLLDQRKQQTNTVIEVETNIISARALSYQYYGTDEEADDIAKLNSGNGIAMEGTVEVFSQ